VEKYECTICGYVYDPAAGDPERGIKPGTPFAELPDDWVCPLCGAAKDMFEKAA
jgi:rubredoxin